MKCLVENCNQETNKGDIMFCINHRMYWIDWIKELGVQHSILFKSDEVLLINEFIKK